MTTTYAYDDASRLQDQVTTKADGTVLESFAYTYDRAGNRVSMTDAAGATATYTYDDRDWLVEEVALTGQTATYDYDAVGNRIGKASGTATWTYAHDADHRLTSWRFENGPVWTEADLTYDGNGNLVKRVETDHENVAYTYEYAYDEENRLVSAEQPDGSVCTYAYGPGGERVRAECSPTTYYGYDFAAPGGFADIAAEYDGNGVRQARYTHGPGADEPLAVLRGGARYAYHADGLGSVSKMTDAAETEVRSYAYDAFGRITSESGTLANPYAFTGREWDSSRELYYYRARSYDPEVGRFLQKDPAGMADGPNLYLYAGNNPVNRVDPSGLLSLCLQACVTASAIRCYWAGTAFCGKILRLGAVSLFWTCMTGVVIACALASSLLLCPRTCGLLDSLLPPEYDYLFEEAIGGIAMT